MKKYSTNRKWEKSKSEIRFEERLKENGFEVKGIKEFIAKTCYVIEKDGVTYAFDLHHADDSAKHGDWCYKVFWNQYIIKVERDRLMDELKKGE